MGFSVILWGAENWYLPNIGALSVRYLKVEMIVQQDHLRGYTVKLVEKAGRWWWSWYFQLAMIVSSPDMDPIAYMRGTSQFRNITLLKYLRAHPDQGSSRNKCIKGATEVTNINI